MVYTKDIKLMAFVISAMFWGSGYAADNSIYLDQAGDNSTVTLTQDGSGNKVKGIINGAPGNTNDPAVLNGNNQTVTVNQVGQNNVLSLGLQTTVSNGIGINLNYSAINGGNVAIINSNNDGTGTSAGNVVSFTHSGGGAITNLDLLGTENTLTVVTSGGANNKFTGTINANNTNVTVNQTLGGGNETTLNLTGNNGQVSLTTAGALNITNITQSGGGANGVNAVIDIAGSSNSTTVTQAGAYDHYAYVKLNSGSDGNIIGISQSGGSGSGHSASIELAAGSLTNTISVTQQGTVSNLVNMKVSGSSNSYTILQK